MNILRRAVLAGVAATGALLATGAMAETITLKLHQFLPQKANVPRLVLDEWIKKVEADSNGTLKIDHYPAMQLGGTPPELFDQVQDGVVDLAWTVNGFTAGRFPRSEVFELPFISPNAEATSRAYWELYEKEMKDTDYKDVHLIGTWVHGPGMIHSVDPVETMEDMQGMKFRIPSRMAGFLLENLGANPIGMPVTQIPEALSKGVIDGAVVPWEVTTALKVPELVTNHTEFAEGYSFYTITFTLAMNKERYESLPAEAKAAIDANSGLEFSAFAGASQAGADGPARQLAVDAGNNIITLSAEESEKWKEFAQPIYQRWVDDVTAKGIDGQALLDEARALIEKHNTQ